MTGTILVCGGTGFVGRNCIERLATRFPVIATYHRNPPSDHPGVRWRRADLTQADQVAQALDGADMVVQAAAVTSGAKDIVERPHIHVADNAVMNSLLFRAAHDLSVGHMVFFSCSIMYPPGDRPVRETDFSGQVHPPYFAGAWTKVYLEKMAEFYAGLGRTRYTVLRHANVYGPHDKFDADRSHMFGATVTKVMSDNPIIVWGDGSEARDLLYVGDLMDCVERAIDRQADPFGLYNVGIGEAFPVRDVVKRLIAAAGHHREMTFDRTKPRVDYSLRLDCSKAARELGWMPKVGLDEGIRRTLEWYRAQFGEARGGV